MLRAIHVASLACHASDSQIHVALATEWLSRSNRLVRRLLTGGSEPQRVHRSDITLELRRVLEGRNNLTCVQVGSNDGVHGDPLHELIEDNRGWRALFIEPIPSIFARLKANYGDAARFAFANVAISDTSGPMRLFGVSERARCELGNSLPFWFDQLGSFNREHIVRHLDGILEPYIVELDVEAVTLNEVLRRHGIDRVDLLHCDTEGHDLVVLSSLDFARYRPLLVLYEHRHLSDEDRAKARSMLGSLGYSLREFEGDTLAVHEDTATRS
jgi:FkbM family methyltransferase